MKEKSKTKNTDILIICDKCGHSEFVDIADFDIDKKCEGCGK